MERIINLLLTAKAGWHPSNIKVMELWIVLLYFYTVPAELYNLTFPASPDGTEKRCFQK